MIVSVIVCTRNRATVLERLLASLVTSSTGIEGAEIIIVDNGSTDHTNSVIDRFVASVSLRTVYEPCTGLSHARNAGWQASRGSLCIFLDDDCVVPEDWLPAWMAGWRRWQGFYSAAPLEASFEPRKPAWADPENYGYLFGHFRPNITEGKTDLLPWGGNMGIQRTLLADIGGFDANLGLAGRRMIAGEETDFFQKAKAKGYSGVFLPEAWAYHVNDAARLTLRYAWRRSVGQGRTMAMMSNSPWLRELSPLTATWRRFGQNLRGASKAFLRRRTAIAFGRVWVQSALAWGHWSELTAERRA